MSRAKAARSTILFSRAHGLESLPLIDYDADYLVLDNTDNTNGASSRLYVSRLSIDALYTNDLSDAINAQAAPPPANLPPVTPALGTVDPNAQPLTPTPGTVDPNPPPTDGTVPAAVSPPPPVVAG